MAKTIDNIIVAIDKISLNSAEELKYYHVQLLKHNMYTNYHYISLKLICDKFLQAGSVPQLLKSDIITPYINEIAKAWQ